MKVQDSVIPRESGKLMDPVFFRRAAVHDARELSQLVNDCYRGQASRRGWTSEVDLLDGPRTQPAEIEELISDPESAILLCFLQDKLVGSVHLQREGESAYLGMLVVRPELQGQGIGKRILQAAEDHIRTSWGIRKMRMTVISVRHELLAFYQRRGYQATGQTLPFESDGRHGTPKVPGLEFDILEKKLAPPDGDSFVTK